jgi:hypothetical protein
MKVLKWSRCYDKCENCNTNESKHKGYGLCVKCWEKLKRNKTLKRKDWQKRFREKNIERIRKNNDKYNHNARQQVIDLLGGKCIRCGFSDIRALQVDHINGGGYRELKNHNSKERLRMVVESVGNKENKYQLLCANCNWIKRFEDKEVRGAPRKY